MKSFLIIGMGNFGHYLCQELAKYDCEIMIIDNVEERVDDMLPYVTSAKIGDCTNMEVLESLGVSNFDACFICVGDNFQNSLEITSLVKELGGKLVISRAVRDLHAKFLLRNGADRVIHPERDVAERIAKSYSNSLIFDYIELDKKNSIYEITPFEECIGKTIKEVNFRTKYGANIIGIKKEGIPMIMPTADYIFKADEHLVVVGETEKMDKIL